MCVCAEEEPCCRKLMTDPEFPGLPYECTRSKGHEGPCVACSTEEHNLTGVGCEVK